MHALSEDTWRDVIAAMDRTYSELVDYQNLLERQNQELDEIRGFMASVLASVSDLLIVVDTARLIERTGGAIATILGTTSDPAPGSKLADLLEPHARDMLFAVLDQVIRDRQPRMVEVEFATADGPTPLEVSVSPRLDTRGRSRGVVLVGRPVGELRSAYRELEASHMALQQAQARLVQQEKMASLGHLVAGVAHELNNPISFVYANTHALEKYTARFETYFDAVQAGTSRPELVALREELRLDRTVSNLREAIRGAKEGAERVRDIVEDLRRLSAGGGGEPVPFDLVTTARTAADWVRRGTKTPVEIVFDSDPVVQAYGTPGPVQQIVMNLVQNAIDALADAKDARIVLTVEKSEGQAVLRVADNGPGIDADKAISIFDPFFTTKPVGKGTGLGLSISHRTAEENNGSLTLLRTGAEGSTFELTLPLSEGA
ncbi:sensor histidine kinase [Litorisediminicola beolgyonensis]|uniref:sensor histidine kinase n=1 Tax=Litorisediminicola beolgyonensis TaxID=1173614 RepID=UPI0036D7EBAF